MLLGTSSIEQTNHVLLKSVRSALCLRHVGADVGMRVINAWNRLSPAVVKVTVHPCK